MTLRPPSSIPEVAADQGCRLGCGPLWHPEDNLLYWLDAQSGRLYRYDPRTGRSSLTPIKERILQFVIGDDGSLLLFTGSGAVQSMQGGSVSILAERLDWTAEMLMDAIAVDREGRLYCAARPVGGRSGALYQVGSDGMTAKVQDGIGRACGLGFDSSGDHLYWCDAVGREVSRLVHDRGTGELSERQTIMRVPASLGTPHGVVVDVKGFLWVAVWGGSCVIRIAPVGREERRIYFTAKLVSGLAFGGTDCRDLYVTTAGAEDRKANGAGAGALYRLRAGVKGAPPALVRWRHT
ncbi:MAG TPA: SMP-30/gluconolactonase/LRE family protein [Spirochaetia bacterium]|nr:SMP-30/gluconolactonase/LRE family protein [Spirochaetia bacterium]